MEKMRHGKKPVLAHVALFSKHWVVRTRGTGSLRPVWKKLASPWERRSYTADGSQRGQPARVDGSLQEAGSSWDAPVEEAAPE